MERTDYVPFNNASGSASVNILAATVRTNLQNLFALIEGVVDGRGIVVIS
jgi:hypothetical protein